MRFQLFDRSHLPPSTLALAVTAAVTILGLAALPAAAQEEAESNNTESAPSARKHRTVIKATQFIDVSEAEAVLALLDVHFALKPDQNLIVLRGESYAVETAIKVIDALDQPRPSIDLQVSVISASQEGKVDVPKDLEAAVDQLRGVFGYSGFTLLDSITLRVLEGRTARADGAIRLGNDTERTGYSFSFQKIILVPDAEERVRNIRLKKLKFEVNGHDAETPRASLMTDVQIREGQKAVIGSSTAQGVGETLILIVEANAPPDPSWQTE